MIPVRADPAKNIKNAAESKIRYTEDLNMRRNAAYSSELG